MKLKKIDLNAMMEVSWHELSCVPTVFYLLSYNQSFVVTFSKHKYD